MTPAFERATQQIKELANIADVVRGYVPNLRVSGPHLVGICPFHTEKTASFEVTPAKGLFHCWGCGVGGDALRFVQLAEGVSFLDARRILAHRYGVRLDRPSTASEIAAARRRRAYNQVLEAECIWFWRWLRAWLQRLRVLYQEALARSETWLERYAYLRRDVAASRLLAALGTGISAYGRTREDNQMDSDNRAAVGLPSSVPSGRIIRPANAASLVAAYRRLRGAGWVVAARERDMAVRDGLTAWFGSGAVADERMRTWGI